MSDQLNPMSESERAAFQTLFGTEDQIIVKNTQPGVVVIGFHKDTGMAGYEVPRGHLPINLTEIFPRDYWLKSNDFRLAVRKGWLKPVKPEEADALLRQETARQAELRRLAALDGDKGSTTKFDAQVGRPRDEMEEGSEDVDINPETSSIVSGDEATADRVGASAADIAQAAASYERGETNPPSSPDDAIGRAAKAEALCDRMDRGSIKPIEALQELDRDSDLYSPSDLALIASRAKFDGVRVLASQLLDRRRRK